jgi:hypothetical protein
MDQLHLLKHLLDEAVKLIPLGRAVADVVTWSLKKTQKLPYHHE